MRTSRIALFVLLAVAVIAASGCRSRVKPKAAPAPTPSQTAERVVPAPAHEFVSNTPEPQRDEFAGADLNRVARERGWIRDAFFGYDSNTLDDDARAALETSARWLRQNPDVQLIVEGHCDERGTEQYNLALGERRANIARQYLAALGVDPARVSHVSFGEERPFAHGYSEEAWRQNRRAHLRLER